MARCPTGPGKRVALAALMVGRKLSVEEASAKEAVLWKWRWRPTPGEGESSPSRVDCCELGVVVCFSVKHLRTVRCL